MQSAAEIRDPLRAAAAAAFAGDTTVLAEARNWLETLSGRELLQVDGFARQFRYDGATLGKSSDWTRDVLESTDIGAAIGSMHHDGHVRERAVRRLASTSSTLSDRMVALRVGDRVEPVRTLATATLMDRTSLVQAVRTMPIFHRFEQRDRGAEAADAYLERLSDRHGAGRTWQARRGSTDRDLRRSAFQHSIAASLIDVEDAISLLHEETDQVVRRALAQVLADRGEPASIREVLLRGRSAECRVQGLVRLRPPDLTNDDVLPLLADSSVLVRLWARKRWHELGGDPVQGCRHLIESAATPSQRAHAYIGLSEAGARIDRSEILGLVREPEPAPSEGWTPAPRARRGARGHPGDSPPGPIHELESGPSGHRRSCGQPRVVVTRRRCRPQRGPRTRDPSTGVVAAPKPRRLGSPDRRIGDPGRQR